MLSEEKLYRAFLASLRLHGHDFVDTRNDDHHHRLAAAVEVLAEAHARGDAGATRMPRGILPSPFTGRYSEFDQALLNAQETGASSARNPYYPGADLPVSDQRAKRILSGLSEAECKLLDQMVVAFDVRSVEPLAKA